MNSLISLLAFVIFLAFMVGLFKPSLVKMPNRKRSSVIYLGCFLVLCFVGAILAPTDSIKQASTTAPLSSEPKKAVFEYAGINLKQYRNEQKQTRHEIVNAYVAFKHLPASSANVFYSCMSENTFSKDGELKLEDVLGWCFNDYERDHHALDNKINLDNFQDNFSGWDGSYRPLEKLIKAGMNDDSSYKHVDTTYRLILNQDPHAIVKTTFRGTNAYGGVVKQSVSARVDVRTGEVLTILDN
ncbi:hypothetical protein CR897_RS15635 [Escherichia coli]|nr:hypothetical protein [Escherichia coli]